MTNDKCDASVLYKQLLARSDGVSGASLPRDNTG